MPLRGLAAWCPSSRDLRASALPRPRRALPAYARCQSISAADGRAASSTLRSNDDAHLRPRRSSILCIGDREHALRRFAYSCQPARSMPFGAGRALRESGVRSRRSVRVELDGRCVSARSRERPVDHRAEAPRGAPSEQIWHVPDRHIGAMPQVGIRADSGTVQRLVGPVDLARFDSTVKVPTEGSGRTSRHPGRRVPVRSLCDGPGVHSAGSAWIALGRKTGIIGASASAMEPALPDRARGDLFPVDIHDWLGAVVASHRVAVGAPERAFGTPAPRTPSPSAAGGHCAAWRSQDNRSTMRPLWTTARASGTPLKIPMCGASRAGRRRAGGPEGADPRFRDALDARAPVTITSEHCIASIPREPPLDWNSVQSTEAAARVVHTAVRCRNTGQALVDST